MTNPLFKSHNIYCPTVVLTALFLGRQLRILRLQGTKRQQCGPIQTQLPDWLDRDRRRDSGDTERPHEERLFAAWFDQTNTPKSSKREQTLCTHGIFFKEHLGIKKKRSIKRHPIRRSRCCFAVHTADQKKRIFRYTLISMLLPRRWNVCTWSPRVFDS